MGSLSDYAENAVIKHLTREAAYTPSATVYLALATNDPTDAATGASMNECANTGSYARVAVTFGAAASRRVTQSGTVAFPTATGAWGTVSYWAILDSGTYGAGNVLASGAVAVPKVVVSGNTPSIPSGETYVEITTGVLSTYAANGMLDRMFRNQAFTLSANYLGLAITTVMTDASTGTSVTEPSGNNYSRLQINNSAGSAPRWSAASGSTAVNNAAWTMPTPSGAWGTVVGAFMADAGTVGNIIWYDNSIVDQAVALNDTVSYAPSAMSLSQA